ncbi:hypothetical protein [Bacillus salipaludis]|uniref:Transposase n=1 Tax=Bacillus salipaludis TaxID=2547811 RepID=A0ABW8RI10_9BACI
MNHLHFDRIEKKLQNRSGTFQRWIGLFEWEELDPYTSRSKRGIGRGILF